MQEFSVLGVEQNSQEPRVVTSKEVTTDVNLLNVMFETNPLGKTSVILTTPLLGFISYSL